MDSETARPGDDCTLLALSMIVPASPGAARFWKWRAQSRPVSGNTDSEYSAALAAQPEIGRLDVADAAQLMACRFPFDFVITNLGVLPTRPSSAISGWEPCGPAVLVASRTSTCSAPPANGALPYHSSYTRSFLFERLERTGRSLRRLSRLT